MNIWREKTSAPQSETNVLNETASHINHIDDLFCVHIVSDSSKPRNVGTSRHKEIYNKIENFLYIIDINSPVDIFGRKL